MPTPVIDPWLVNADGTPDPFASTVDFGMTTRDEVDPSLLDDEPTPLNPEVIGNQPPAPSEEVDEPTPAPTPVVEETTGPEIVELEDGAFVSLEREAKGWKATLDPGTGHAEIFWGNTKNELMVNVLKGKLNATKKIRELNKKVKLTANTPAAPRQSDPTPAVRQLTADEVFEIKTLWESDPAAALDMLVKRRTNVSLEELVGKAQRGDQANMNLETENTSKEFLSRNPDYYPDSENKNFQSLIKWLAKFKLGKTATEANAGEIFTELWQTGNYTVDNLEEAFEDLTEDGLMVKPRLPKPSPPVEPTPAPAAPTPRIVKTETRPRAALGIGRSDATAPAPTPQSAPTDEDLDNLSDEQIKALLGGVRRQRVAARRSN